MRWAAGALIGMLGLRPLSAWGAPAEEPPPPSIQVGGLVMARADASSLDGYARRYSLANARLSLEATAHDLVRAVVEADVAERQPLRDAFIELKLGAGFELSAGRFKAPFSVREQTSRWKLLLTDRGLVNDALTGAGFAGRHIGFQLGYRPPGLGKRLKVEVGAFSGAGEQEDLAGRLELRPFPSLSVGLNLYRQGQGRLGLASGADLSVRLAGFFAQVEALRFALAPATLLGSGPAERALGVTALLARRFPVGRDVYLEPLAGAEWLSRPSSESARALVAGLNIGRGDAYRLQLQALSGQSALQSPRERRLIAQLGTRF